MTDDRADALFTSLHNQGSPLVLPNAWDAGSARLIEQLGAKAIATTSAGVAWSLGYRDGDVLPLDAHLAVAAAISRVIRVPLSIDLEGGYSDDPSEVAATVFRFIDVGVVGINLQDGTSAPTLLAAKIAAARKAAQKAGIHLYINARTDVYARRLVADEDALTETLRRARLYKEAGADGLFPLTLTDASEIRTLAAESGLALSLVAWPGLPRIPELAELGVKRVTMGSWLPQTMWAESSRLVTALLSTGDHSDLYSKAAFYTQVNELFRA